MSRFVEAYQQKLTTPERALSCIQSHHNISASLCAMEPFTLLGHLHTLRGKVEGLNVFIGLTLGNYPFMQDPVYRDTFTVDSGFYMEQDRQSARKGISSFVPNHLHHMAVRRYSYRPVDVALMAASPMDTHGYFRCSLTNLHERELLESGAKVVLEVNPNLPPVNGDTAIHIDRVHSLIEVNTPVPMLPRGAVSDIDMAIGEYIATLVEDGDTIQLGIGAIPDAAAQALTGKKHLGIHTEMITNSVVDLVEAGVVDGSRKSLHPGKIIGAFALGDQRLYDMMRDNPNVEILRASYVNHPAVVARNDNMVSVNTCIAVDLTGQVASETIGVIQYSGSGGQSDTAYGAIHAKNGRSIIALHATAKEGTVSTISGVLPAGAVVTLSRNNVDYIVTEYGIAALKGRSVRERTANLIAVAHPDFRDALRQEAKEYGFI